MKKVSLLICLALAILFVLTSCGKKKAEEAASAETAAAETTKAAESTAEVTETEPETITMTAPDGSTVIVEDNSGVTVDTIDVTKLPRGYSGEDIGLTEHKWKETTQNIAIMKLNDDGTGVFENADVKFFWYFENDMLTLHYDVNFGNVTPTTFTLTEENGVKTLTEITSGDSVFIQE